jgi:hypothetical protein
VATASIPGFAYLHGQFVEEWELTFKTRKKSTIYTNRGGKTSLFLKMAGIKMEKAKIGNW